jgi:hypothetical protein
VWESPRVDGTAHTPGCSSWTPPALNVDFEAVHNGPSVARDLPRAPLLVPMNTYPML